MSTSPGRYDFLLKLAAVTAVVAAGLFATTVDASLVKQLSPAGWSVPKTVGVLYAVLMLAFVASWIAISLVKPLRRAELETVGTAWIACLGFFLKLQALATRAGDAHAGFVGYLLCAAVLACLTAPASRVQGGTWESQALALASFGVLAAVATMSTVAAAVIQRLQGAMQDYAISPSGTVLVGIVTTWPLISEVLWVRVLRERPQRFRVVYACFISMILACAPLAIVPTYSTGGWADSVNGALALRTFIVLVALGLYILAGVAVARWESTRVPTSVPRSVVLYSLAGIIVGGIIAASWRIWGTGADASPWGGWWIVFAHGLSSIILTLFVGVALRFGPALIARFQGSATEGGAP